MSDFVIFNELSLPLSDHHWCSQIKSYLDVVNQLQAEGIASIRIEQHFADLPLFTQTKSLQQLFGGLERDMQTRLKSLLFNQSLIFKSPLIAAGEDQQQTELTINSEYSFDGDVNSGGLACAHIYNTLAISFLTDDKWAAAEIELVRSHIEQDDQQVSVEHLSKVEHCQQHQLSLLELITIPETAQQLLAFCAVENKSYPYQVRFTEQAQDQLNQLMDDESLKIRIYELLKSLKKTPNEGLGKPELLKENLSGFASRRINQEHRLVYKQRTGHIIEVSRCLGHYG